VTPAEIGRSTNSLHNSHEYFFGRRAVDSINIRDELRKIEEDFIADMFSKLSGNLHKLSRAKLSQLATTMLSLAAPDPPTPLSHHPRIDP
jgi:hypothetical protein